MSSSRALRAVRAWSGHALLAILALLAVTAATMPNAVAGDAGQPQQQALARANDTLTSIDHRSDVASATEFAELSRIADRKGSVPVIVGLRTRFTPEGLLTSDQRRAQRAATESEARRVLRSIHGTRHRVLRTFRTVPYVALELSSAALAKLQSSRRAASLTREISSRPHLDVSTEIVESNDTTSLGRKGQGQTIAILDSGIDKTHPFLQKAPGGPTKVVAEACYSQNNNCPNGQTTDTSAGSGAPCNIDHMCTHGTHVAGIAAGNGAAAGKPFSGVAPAATLISIQVFSDVNGQSRSFPDDQMAGLQHVYELRNDFKIASVNMSFGSPPTGSGSCDDNPLAPLIQNLLSVGITSVISSGNEGSNSGVGSPACISAAVTVGATTDIDTVASYSNSSNLVDLLAPGGAGEDDPGTAINSSIPLSMDTLDGKADGYEEKSGTSMAAPHVAGALAVLRSITPGIDASYMLSYLQQSGKPITDPLNGVTKYRIRVLAAAILQGGDTGFKAGGSFTYSGGGVVSAGVGLAQRAGAPTLGSVTLNVPSDATVRKAFVYWMTIGGEDPAFHFCREDNTGACLVEGSVSNGVLRGASANTGWSTNQYGPIRTYRALLPAGAVVAGTRTYEVSGIGRRSTGVDGEGAALVVIYSRPSAASGTIVLRDGAMTLTSGETVTDKFGGLSVPSAPSAVTVGAGFGDGEPGAFATEDPLKFQGTPITASNSIFGADGPQWDTKQVSVGTGLLPSGTTTRNISIKSTSDVFAWGYSVLAYQY